MSTSLFYDIIRQKHKLKASIGIEKDGESKFEITDSETGKRLILDASLMSVVHKLLEGEASALEIYDSNKSRDLPLIPIEEICRTFDSLGQLGMLAHSPQKNENISSLEHKYIPLQAASLETYENFRELQETANSGGFFNFRNVSLFLLATLIFFLPWNKKVYGPVIVEQVQENTRVKSNFYVNHSLVGMVKPGDPVVFRLQSYVRNKFEGTVTHIQTEPSKIPYRELKRFGVFYIVEIESDLSNFDQNIIKGMSGYALIRKEKTLLGYIFFRNVWLSVANVFDF